MPFVDRDLAGEDGRAASVAFLEDFVEVTPGTGIERFDALAVIRAIDQQIGRLHRAARLAPRPYRLVVLSDHGVTQGQAFADRFGESVEAKLDEKVGFSSVILCDKTKIAPP